MGKLIKLFLLFVFLSGGLVPNIFASEDYYAPNMLIPKKVYQDVTYDVPRMNRVKSNELFEGGIFNCSYFPLAAVVHYPPGMYSHEYLMVTDPGVHRIIVKS